LFETVGGWVTAVPELAVKATLATQSHHHAWHAELWHGLLPSIPDHLRPADLVVPAGAGDRALVDGLAGAPGTVGRVAGLYRVALPRLIAAYTDHLALTTPVTDGPAIRALRLVLADEHDDRAAGEALLDAALAADPTLAERVAVEEARLRALAGGRRPGRRVAGRAIWRSRPADIGGAGSIWLLIRMNVVSSTSAPRSARPGRASPERMQSASRRVRSSCAIHPRERFPA